MGLHCCKEERPGFFPVPLETVTRQPTASHPTEPNMSSQSVFWTRPKRRLIIPYTVKKLKFQRPARRAPKKQREQSDSDPLYHGNSLCM
jgi:hypothetical protein